MVYRGVESDRSHLEKRDDAPRGDLGGAPTLKGALSDSLPYGFGPFLIVFREYVILTAFLGFEPSKRMTATFSGKKGLIPE